MFETRLNSLVLTHSLMRQPGVGVADEAVVSPEWIAFAD